MERERDKSNAGREDEGEAGPIKEQKREEAERSSKGSDHGRQNKAKHSGN